MKLMVNTIIYFTNLFIDFRRMWTLTRCYPQKYVYLYISYVSKLTLVIFLNGHLLVIIAVVATCVINGATNLRRLVTHGFRYSGFLYYIGRWPRILVPDKLVSLAFYFNIWLLSLYIDNFDFDMHMFCWYSTA